MDDVQICSLNLGKKEQLCPLKFNVKLDLIMVVNVELLL